MAHLELFFDGPSHLLRGGFFMRDSNESCQPVCREIAAKFDDVRPRFE